MALPEILRALGAVEEGEQKGGQLALDMKHPGLLRVEKCVGAQSEVQWAEMALEEGLLARWALQGLRTICLPHVILITTLQGIVLFYW